MVIQVTKEDILDGEIASHTSCPVALALRRETGESWRVNGTCASHLRKKLVVFFPPRIVDSFIEKFDTRGRSVVAPFEFDFPWERAMKTQWGEKALKTKEKKTKEKKT